MSNSKISALTSATTPLAGTEVLPVVQSSTTKQVSVANLTAGRAVSVKNITASDLTSGRVAYVGTSGLIQDSANFQFNGNDAAVGRTPSTFNTAYKGLQVGGSGGNDIVLVGGDASLGTGYYLSGLGAYAYSQTGSTVGTINLYNKQMIFKVAAAGTAGNAISWTQIGGFTTAGDFEMTTGNLIPATAAKGINFTANTPASGMTSQLLNWYEQGVWTTGMTADGGTVTLSYDKLNYTRAGRIVAISGEIVVSAISSPTGDIYISLPFTNSASTSGRSGAWSSYLGTAYTFTGVPLGPMVGLMTGGATKMTIRVGNNAGGTAASGFLIVGTTFDFGFTYQCQ